MNMLLHLVGVVTGSWLLQNGAASTILVGICTYALVIPLLTYLPLPDSEDMGTCSKDVLLKPIRSDLEQVGPGIVKSSWPEPKTRARRAFFNNSIKAELLESVRILKNMLLTNRIFNMCLAIMFLNSTAMGVRILFRPWTSKRYDWTLAQTGYVLSAEGLVSTLILFLLPLLGKFLSPGDAARSRGRDIKVATICLIWGIIGAILLAISESRGLFLFSLVVFSGSVGFPDSIKAYFTSHFENDEIGRLYIFIAFTETLAMILTSPIWGFIFSTGYAWGKIWVGLPFLFTGALLLVTLLVVRQSKAREVSTADS